MIVSFPGAVALAVIVIVGTHGFLGIVRLVKVYDVVIFRGQGILAIRFLLGVVSEGDRDLAR